MESIFLAIIILIAIIGFIIYSFIWQQKQLKKAQVLFDDNLTNLCYNARTIDECNNAWNVLMQECIDGKMFKIPTAYQKDFYELRANLQGKLQVLENRNKNNTNK